MGRLIIPVLAVAAFFGCSATEVKEDPEELSGPTNIGSFHRSVAYSLLKNHQPEGAVPHIKQLLAMQPDQAEPHYLMGRALLSMRLFKQSRNELERAIQLDKNQAPAPALMGVLLDLMEEHAQAEKYHRQAILLNPQSGAYYNNLGFGLFLQKRYREAQEAFETALEHDPNLSKAHNNLGFALGMLGEPIKAFEHFAIAGTKDQAYNNLGYIYELRGDWERSIEYYQKAIEANPQHERAQKNLAHVMLQRDETTQKVPIGEENNK